MKMRRITMALGLLAVIATPVLAAGLFSNYPLVGGAQFCSTTNQAGVPGTASVCTTTTPAGPSVVTGLETVPADTHSAGGAQPQTVNLSLASLNALPWTKKTVFAVATTLTPSALDGGFMIDSATAALTPTMTIFLPGSPIDRQMFGFSTDQALQSISIAVSDGSTVKNAATALTPSTTSGGSAGYEWIFNKADKTWYRKY